MNVWDSDILPSRVKLLGVHIGSNLSLNTQVSKTVSSGFFFQLRQIKAIRMSLPSEAVRYLVNAFVVSMLDYMLTYQGHSWKDSNLYSMRRQKLIFCPLKYYHVTSLLRNCSHLLRCPEIQVVLNRFQGTGSQHGMTPGYELDLCILDCISRRDQRGDPRRRRWSAALWSQSVATTQKFGDRAYAVAGKTAWNRVPADIRQR